MQWPAVISRLGPINVAVLAQANKTARIAWALLTKGEDYRRPVATAA